MLAKKHALSSFTSLCEITLECSFCLFATGVCGKATILQIMGTLCHKRTIIIIKVIAHVRVTLVKR